MLATLVIVFREAMEAGLIVGIVLAATKGVAGRGRAVAGGVAGGVLGACVVAAFAGRIADLFQGSGQELFNAAILGLAVLMLSWHVIWMSRHGREMAAEARGLGRDVADGRRTLAALALVVGIAVLREGAEVVLFLYGVAISGGASTGGMLLGGALGLLAAAALTALTYAGLVKLPMGALFGVTGWLVTLLAAGLAAQSALLLQSAGLVEGMSSVVWDSSWLLSDGGWPGRLLHTLVGYTARPDLLQVVVYAVAIVAISGLAKLAAPSGPAGGMRPHSS